MRSSSRLFPEDQLCIKQLWDLILNSHSTEEDITTFFAPLSLEKKQAVITAVDQAGWTSLHVAARYNLDPGSSPG